MNGLPVGIPDPDRTSRRLEVDGCSLLRTGRGFDEIDGVVAADIEGTAGVVETAEGVEVLGVETCGVEDDEEAGEETGTPAVTGGEARGDVVEGTARRESVRRGTRRGAASVEGISPSPMTTASARWLTRRLRGRMALSLTRQRRRVKG